MTYSFPIWNQSVVPCPVLSVASWPVYRFLKRQVRKLVIPKDFHAKMCTIKDRNGMDLTEAEDIKKRWKEYTEEIYKKNFMTQIIMMV